MKPHSESAAAKKLLSEELILERREEQRRENEQDAAKIERYEKALREIGLPKHVPEHFNREEFWKHLASKRSEIARDALGVTAEELILDAAE